MDLPLFLTQKIFQNVSYLNFSRISEDRSIFSRLEVLSDSNWKSGEGLSASLPLSLTRQMAILQPIGSFYVQNLPHVPGFYELAGVRHLLWDLARQLDVNE